MDLLASENIWIIYLSIVIGPFVQEDVAVAGAAGLSVANPHLFPIIFPLILFGLIISDIWKYGLGVLARTKGWAKRYAAKPKVASAAEKMRDHPGLTLMALRFIPLTRVPAYIAAGFVRVPYMIFCAWVALSALIYVVLVFGLFHLLGEVLGEQVKAYLPILAIALVLIALAVQLIRSKLAKPSL